MFLKAAISTRTVLGGVLGALYLTIIVNNAGVNPLPFLAAPVVNFSITGLVLGVLVSHGIVAFLARGYRERSYAVAEPKRRLESYSRKFELPLQEAGFSSIGCYRVCGSAFKTFTDVHLGCKGMVIAEFISLSGTLAIELISLTESGVCVATSSCNAPEGQRPIQWGGRACVRYAGT